MESRLQVLLLSLTLIAGCTSFSEIQINDNVDFTHLETSFPVSDDERSRIRIRGSAVSGDYYQALNTSHILIDDTSIWSPTSFNGVADINYYSIAYGLDNISVQMVPGQPYGFMYAGIQQTNLDVTLQHINTTYKISDEVRELYFQAGFYSAMTDSMMAEVSYAFSLSQEASSMAELDLKLNFQLARQVRLAVGYRLYEYSYMENATNSDILVSFKGPLFVVNIPF